MKKRRALHMEEEVHDLHDFFKQSQISIQAEYDRIQKNVKKDPGTAGDQGEENWKEIFEKWLPPYFSVVTKGKILFSSGYFSPQIDVLVLRPSYPPMLKNRKHYMADGVAAAFECKTTLDAGHIRDAIETCSLIKEAEETRLGSPRKELCSEIVFGVLAHSHSWKEAKSQPADNITNAIIKADLEFVKHPKNSLDFLCVADLGTWHCHKTCYVGPLAEPLSELNRERYGADGKVLTMFFRNVNGEDRQEEYFSPIGSLLAGLTDRLAWKYDDMQAFSNYFSKANAFGSGIGVSRMWELSVYSEAVRRGIYQGHWKNGCKYDDWNVIF